MCNLHHMKKNKQLLYIVLGIAAFFPIWLLFHRVATRFSRGEAMSYSFAFTLAFVSGMYAGRSMALLWMNIPRRSRNVLLVLLPVVSCAILLSISFLTDQLARMDGSGNSPRIVLLVAAIFILALSAGIFIKLIRADIQKTIRAAETKAAQSESELQLLQSQLSPHFLFNTLNNLYAISMTASGKVPPLLLKLSELLRYSVYEAGALLVPLHEEINYLKNYIAFEQLRIGDRLELTTELEETDNKQINIAPMLLIVFVENAFKHAKNTTEQKIYIAIKLKLWNSSILFSVTNSYRKENVATTTTGKNSGLGLTNVKKRLAMLYANEHDLKIEQTPEQFSVMLRVNAK